MFVVLHIIDAMVQNRITRGDCSFAMVDTPPSPYLTVGNTHAEIIRSPTLRLIKTQRFEPKISNLDSSDQRIDLHRSNVHCSSFLAQASLFLLLVSFSSGFKSNQILLFTYTWLADFNASVAKYLCF